MRAKDRNSRDTRWLYKLENATLKYNRFANEDRPIGFLRGLADKVWAAEAPEGRKKPSVTAADGLLFECRGGKKKRTSFCAGFTEIVLARRHRNVLVLLHELTHALGPCVHGRKFIRLYFRLLHKFAGYNRIFLQTVAAERGIAL